MRTSLPLAAAGALAAATLSVVSVAPAAVAAPAETAYALNSAGTQLLSFPVSNPAYVTSKAITGSPVVGDTLVGIDIRPQNGYLYAFGVNAAANTGTLYTVSEETGAIAPISASGVAFTTNGATPVDLPDPSTTGYGVDFNPFADRVRVIAGGVNFRINPNTGAGVDGDGITGGVQPDGAINGAAVSVEAAAYTNNRPNTITTTLYTLSAAGNLLMIQNPPNNGTQTNAVPVTVNGSVLDFTGVGGFDIEPAVNAGYAALHVAGTSRLYRIDLVTGAATALGRIGTGAAVSGLALARDLDDSGRPVVALSSNGTTITRFASGIPGTATTTPVSGVTAGETLVAICWRPRTGQLLGLGVNATANNGTLYVVDPQTGIGAALGAASGIAFVDDVQAPVDLPDPTTTGYGFDVNPIVDRVRFVAGSGLNGRINPVNGAPIDGDATEAGVQPDAAQSLIPGATAASYTNAYGGTLTATLYDLVPSTNQLFIQEPPNNGELVQGKTVTLNGAELNFTTLAGLDIPANVAVATNGAVAQGKAIAALTVGGVGVLYELDLATAKATLLGPTATTFRSIAVGDAEQDRAKIPATLKKVAKPKQVKAKVNTGRVLVCPPGFATPQCSATVTLKAGKKLLGKATVRVNRGAQKRLVVKLSPKGRSFLVKKGTVKSVVTITCPCGPEATAKKYRLRLTLKAARL